MRKPQGNELFFIPGRNLESTQISSGSSTSSRLRMTRTFIWCLSPWVSPSHLQLIPSSLGSKCLKRSSVARLSGWKMNVSSSEDG